ncbi:hypothetical protein [Clostridium vitabionis]|uniref:hypothetical protein n=1 Tax=Clostridium vitabionis TaxID=2784388 RepID=UPI00188D60C4|nr:hypothetical protein [Clostridium vitabionis]
MDRRKLINTAVPVAFAALGAALALGFHPGRTGTAEAGEVPREATAAELSGTLPEESLSEENSSEPETALEASAEEASAEESTAAAEIHPIPVTSILHGVHLWTGFAACESDGENGRSAGSDGGHAYGIFQFDDRCDLDWFLRQCLAANPVKYAAFRPFTEKMPEAGGDDAAVALAQSENAAVSAPAAGTDTDSAADAPEESLEVKIAEKAATEAELSRRDEASLIDAWHKVYDADPEGFTDMQLRCFAKLYYPACVRQCAARGIDLNSSAYSPVLRGTLWSISIWAGTGGLQNVVDKLSPAMTESEMLDVCYSEETASLKTGTPKYRTRWTSRQPALAGKALERWSAGKSIPEYVGS